MHPARRWVLTVLTAQCSCGANPSRDRQHQPKQRRSLTQGVVQVLAQGRQRVLARDLGSHGEADEGKHGQAA